MKKRPELLLPAGEIKSVYMAFMAGADAVYLGAPVFSARAYAKNPEIPEICEALDYAHLHGKKIYLACNTLMRNSELEMIPGVCDPLYEHGLDGVIIQDIALLDVFGKRYPKLPLHASTQMSILSSAGCEWLKKHKVTRVVPGRELSLNEIKELKETGLEVECFIHGAMCYSYSGRCLMSSLAGGRSGNRGRCAGPCRQKYTAENGKSGYYLSMKDMNSVNAIPELIDAGVDSFKIEGRMKDPEYVAGTAEVYRKCIDSYLDTGRMEIGRKEREQLDKLYIRSERQEGYLHKHNGADMVSVSSPAYTKVPGELKKDIAGKYADKKLKIPVDMKMYCSVGSEAVLSVSCGNNEVAVTGETVQRAKKAPLSADEISARLKKTGDTSFEAADIRIDADDDIFMPVSALNELRRKALDGLEKDLLKDFMRKAEDIQPGIMKPQIKNGQKPYISVYVTDGEQLAAAIEYGKADRIVLPAELFEDKGLTESVRKSDAALCMAMPEIVRQKDLGYIGRLLEEHSGEAELISVNSIDGLLLAEKYFERERIHADAGLYAMNDLSAGMLLSECAAYTLCPEQNRKEYENAAYREFAELNVYGRTPVMISANCVLKNTQGCDMSRNTTYITDDSGRSFPVLMRHKMCYNIILNCVPTSLHKEYHELYEKGGYGGFGFRFTTESKAEVREVLELFGKIRGGAAAECPYEFTRGHFRRGAE